MKILVTGGGIAGSTLAYALHRLGKDYIVVAEARREPGDAFLTLAPNGVNGLKSIGLGDVPTIADRLKLSGLDFHRLGTRETKEQYGYCTSGISYASRSRAREMKSAQ